MSVNPNIPRYLISSYPKTLIVNTPKIETVTKIFIVQLLQGNSFKNVACVRYKANVVSSWATHELNLIDSEQRDINK